MSNKLVITKNADIAKILVIDEDGSNLENLKRILEKHFPHEILTAYSGIDGLEILHKTQVSLVISNANMRLITESRILNFLKKKEKLKIFLSCRR